MSERSANSAPSLLDSPSSVPSALLASPAIYCSEVRLAHHDGLIRLIFLDATPVGAFVRFSAIMSPEQVVSLGKGIREFVPEQSRQ